ncbi:hypothetical protein BJX61DRAFT_31649 [Aspergillus egyptiacus]|nr:hypothetical protein BJX61DRAFT_31649 [Aspergillus egyptiacus]
MSYAMYRIARHAWHCLFAAILIKLISIGGPWVISGSKFAIDVEPICLVKINRSFQLLAMVLGN